MFTHGPTRSTVIRCRLPLFILRAAVHDRGLLPPSQLQVAFVVEHTLVDVPADVQQEWYHGECGKCDSSPGLSRH
jgi:hypothetical protein